MVDSQIDSGQVAKHASVLGRPGMRCYLRCNCIQCQIKPAPSLIRGGILMGSAARPRPARLTEKLLQIRLGLGLSQNEMLVALGLGEKVFRSAVSGYELGRREPPLPILLKYARLAGISTDVLIDDELDLPKRIKPRH